ncbi:hypothetical protein GCM10009677_64200 [Sphaerisporangium rubeum]
MEAGGRTVRRMVLDDSDHGLRRYSLSWPDHGTDREVRGAQATGVNDRDHTAVGESPRVSHCSWTGGVDRLTCPGLEVHSAVAAQPGVERRREGTADVGLAVQG